MPLESCIICLDNSEWTRNGDYMPTRLLAQVDATNMITSRKINPPSHPESTVGILTMGGKGGCEVRVSPTRDTSKLLMATNGIEMSGSLNFCDGIKIAQLALKHRQNMAGEQRIIAFVCSPVEDSEKELKKLAAFLRKEGILIDIVSMGETAENEEKLTTFLKNVDKNGENTHLITIPPGTLPSSVLRNSVLVSAGTGGAGESGGDAGAAAGGAPGGFGEFGGIDPSEDPEMAMVIQMSLMEARSRLEASAKVAAEGAPEAATPAAIPASTAPAADVEMSEEELLQQALQMSMLEEEEAASAAAAAPAASTVATSPAPALDAAGAGAPFLDPSFVHGMLADLPGVDLSDPRIIAAMNALSGGTVPEEKKDGEKKEDKK